MKGRQPAAPCCLMYQQKQHCSYSGTTCNWHRGAHVGPTSHGHHGAEATAGHPGEQERMRLHPPPCRDFSLQNHQPERGSAVGLPGLGSSHLRTGVEVGDKKGAGGGQSAVMEGHGDCAQRRPRAPSYRGVAFTDSRTHARGRRRCSASC